MCLRLKIVAMEVVGVRQYVLVLLGIESEERLICFWWRVNSC